MERKIRTLSHSPSSSSRPRASTSSTGSSSTSSSSSSSTDSSSSDSDTSTSQESSMKSIAMGSPDSDIVKPPNKKARVSKTKKPLGDVEGLRLGRGQDEQAVSSSEKQHPTRFRNQISDNPVTKEHRLSLTKPRPRTTSPTTAKITCRPPPKDTTASAHHSISGSNGTLLATQSKRRPTPNVANTDKRHKFHYPLVSGSEAESVSDYDRGNRVDSLNCPTKKQTCSFNDIKSKCLTTSEESESDTKHNLHLSSKVKKNSWEEVSFPEVLINEQRCPLRDCDSLGHLGGCLAKHFTKEACPMYHNWTVKECETAYDRRQKNIEMLQMATASEILNRPRSKVQETNKEYKDGKTKELRIVLQDYMNTEKSNIPDTGSSDAMDTRVNREPKLAGVAPEHDLYLFREAQAIASENIEQDQNLPYAMGTKLIEMGKYNVQVWYQSPYPEDFAHAPKLYICEYCLHYMKSNTTSRRHALKCVWRHPPGEEIYRNQKTSVWEVDGKKNREYCQNLCLLAKFFLDHKTLHDNVEPFFFYVMTRLDSHGCHAVGYFSKEKNSSMNYNVSCILTFPHYQRQGYGRLLIDFSYLLTRVEGKVGTPEKPLSDLGLISYRSYWKDVLLNYLHKFTGKELSIRDISQETGVNSYDIVSTLQALGMIKYWKGKHIILKQQDVIDEYVESIKMHGTKNKHIDPLLLKWVPKTPR